MVRTMLVYMTHPHVEAWMFRPRHREILLARVPGLDVVMVSRSKEFLERLPEADAVAVWYFKKEWLELAPKLRLIVTPAAGRDWIEPEPGGGLQVWFGGFHGPMIAESVVGAMLYFAKAFGPSLELQRKRKWARVKISEQIRTLEGAAVTILGFGKIGQAIGRRLKPFGCRITGVRRRAMARPDYFTGDDAVESAGRLKEVLAGTDHLILALPGGRETEGLLGREQFRLLPAGAFLYNVGRGNACREADLALALREGDVSGAYLDVFETEPLPEDSPLWAMDNVLIQPHLSAASPDYLDRFARELAARLSAGGEPV